MYANRMMMHYHRFNKEFFAGFNQLQSSICIDAMDKFSEFTENELNLFRIATRNRFPNTDIEKKYMIAHIHVCKLLAAQADGIWSIIYRNRYGGRDYDVNLQGMYVSARELLETYQKENLPKEQRVTGLVNDEDIERAKERFAARVMAFIREWK